MFLISGLLFPLAVVGGIAYLIVNATRARTDKDRGGPGSATSIRRLFQYALLLTALVVAASGVNGVLSRVIADAAARRGSDLAGPMALTVVGVPVFWLLARWIWRQLLTDPAEQRSVGWGFYINITLIGSLITVVSMAFAIAQRLIEGNGYDGTLVAPFLVAGAVWWAHWMAWRRTPPAVLSDGHVMAGATLGLGLMAGGAGFVITTAMDRAFEHSRGVDVSRFLGDNLSMAIVAIAFGAVSWTWHWLRNGLNAERSILWHGYVILIGILGGLLTTVIGGATALFLTLQWVFGDPEAVSAAAHFQEASPAFAAGAIGLAVWFYHRTVLGFDNARARTDIDRIYDYLVAGVALATVAGAMTTLIVALFSVFSSDDVVSDGGSDINIVIAAVTLLLVGAPLWAVAWRRAQQALTADTEGEATSGARRVYLFVVFGLGGAIAFGTLIRLMLVVFEAVLGERSGGALLDDISVPIALLTTTGAVAGYHWSVYRAERLVEESRPWREVTVVWAGNGAVDEIAKRAHVRLEVMHRLDVEGAGPTTDEIVSAIEQAEGERLIIVVGLDGIEVIPVQPR